MDLLSDRLWDRHRVAFQPPYITVQTVLPKPIVSKALVMLSFTQQFGGILILSIAQNVFLNHLSRSLAAIVPGVNGDVLLGNAALGLINAVPTNLRGQALVACNSALVDIFYVALGPTCAAVVCILGIEWKSVKMGQVE